MNHSKAGICAGHAGQPVDDAQQRPVARHPGVGEALELVGQGGAVALVSTWAVTTASRSRRPSRIDRMVASSPIVIADRLPLPGNRRSSGRVSVSRVLAETVSIDGGTLLVILAVLVVVVGLAIAVVVFGFVLAPRAGRGSQSAMGWWVFLLALESLCAIGSLAALRTSDFSVLTLLPSAIIACQVGLYLQARKNAGR